MKLSQDSSLGVTRFGDWEKRKMEETDIFGISKGAIEYFNPRAGQAFTFALEYGHVAFDLRTLVVHEAFLDPLVNRLKREGRASPVLAFSPNAFQENIPWETAYVLTEDTLPEGQKRLKLFCIEKTGKSRKEVKMPMSESRSQEFFLELKNHLLMQNQGFLMKMNGMIWKTFLVSVR